MYHFKEKLVQSLDMLNIKTFGDIISRREGVLENFDAGYGGSDQKCSVT